LPKGKKYEELYGIKEEEMKDMGEVVKPRYNVEKCKYPKCSICMVNCPTQSINLPESPPLSHKTCGVCFFCEQICPTGAIEIDWEFLPKDIIKDHLSQVAWQLEEFKDLRRFRSLVPFEEIGRYTPFYEVQSKHPRFVIRDGVGVMPR